MKNCPSCGALNQDENLTCVRCAVELPAREARSGYAPPLSNYLLQAILCTIFCCLPFGIVAIVYAAQVNGFQQSGNFSAARQASENAKNWCWYSFWATAAVYLGAILLAALGALHY